jgi:hypothetical protein
MLAAGSAAGNRLALEIRHYLREEPVFAFDQAHSAVTKRAGEFAVRG